MMASGSDQLSYKRRQRQEDKQHAERENEHGGVALQDFLQGQFGPFKAHAGRQFFPHQLFHRGDGLAGTDAGRRVAGDLGGRIHVVAHDTVRPGDRCAR